jgi:bromodomain-containing protein 8
MFLNAFVAHSNNLKLAQRMYQARVLELKQLILAEEARFKFVFILKAYTFSLTLAISSVAAEIEAIRAGKWDVKIEKDLVVDETTPDRPSPSPSPQSEVCPSISST